MLTLLSTAWSLPGPWGRCRRCRGGGADSSTLWTLYTWYTLLLGGVTQVLAPGPSDWLKRSDAEPVVVGDRTPCWGPLGGPGGVGGCRCAPGGSWGSGSVMLMSISSHSQESSGPAGAGETGPDRTRSSGAGEPGPDRTRSRSRRSWSIEFTVSCRAEQSQGRKWSYTFVHQL